MSTDHMRLGLALGSLILLIRAPREMQDERRRGSCLWQGLRLM